MLVLQFYQTQNAEYFMVTKSQIIWFVWKEIITKEFVM
jgi:hypothetical protein